MMHLLCPMLGQNSLRCPVNLLAKELIEQPLLRLDDARKYALHCSGIMDEMIRVAASVPEMTPEGQERLARAMATLRDDDGPDFAEAAAKRDALLALA